MVPVLHQSIPSGSLIWVSLPRILTLNCSGHVVIPEALLAHQGSMQAFLPICTGLTQDLMCFLVGLLKVNTGLWGEERSNYQFLQPIIITRFLTLHGTSFCLLFWIYFLPGADIRKPRSVAGRQSGGGQWSGASCSSGRVDRYPTEALKMSLLLTS